MTLSISGLSFAYGRNDILEDVNFSLEQGQIVVLLGPNGTGKTTLLRAINGILRPAMGTVLLDGRSLASCPRRDRAKIFGYVPQRDEPQHLTVFDAVLLGRRPHIAWTVKKEDVEKVGMVLRALSLEKFSLRFLDELSGGEFQKVALARALVQEPKVLLLDEPTSSLDLKNQIDMLRTLRQIVQERNVAILMSIHDLNTSLRVADRLIFLRDGVVCAACRPAEATADLIGDVYGLPVDVIAHDGAPLVIPRLQSGPALRA